MSFEDFPLTKFRNKIIQNRKEKPYHFDDRNTASYYLFCMARYAMLKMAIEENYFNSTHFSWLNICIERMGWKNLVALPSIWETKRDKFSTCWIDYWPEPVVRNLPEYFQFGRCGMCSGFFTGNAYYMKEFCNQIEDKFMEALNAGYGHADEQLYLMVYFHGYNGAGAKEIFDTYIGDYTEMVTNYVAPKERVGEPIRNVISNSFRAGDYTVCEKGCAAVWDACKKGLTDLEPHQITYLTQMYKVSLKMNGKLDLLP
jgi:hypothetical protein